MLACGLAEEVLMGPAGRPVVEKEIDIKHNESFSFARYTALLTHSSNSEPDGAGAPQSTLSQKYTHKCLSYSFTWKGEAERSALWCCSVMKWNFESIVCGNLKAHVSCESRDPTETYCYSERMSREPQESRQEKEERRILWY